MDLLHTNPVPRGRILAIDYGERRIGLAVSDPLTLTVRPDPPTFVCSNGEEGLHDKASGEIAPDGTRGQPLFADINKKEIITIQKRLNETERLLMVLCMTVS